MNESLIEKQTYNLSMELAQLFNTSSGEKIFQLLKRSEGLARCNEHEMLPKKIIENTIGIWERTVNENGEKIFSRSAKYFDEWHCWADQACIGPKGLKKRIVLIGESVARGYFYDPCFTPASYLENVINTYNKDHCEVIDLARIDITAKGLWKIIAALPSLAPDVIVLFAGNNWVNEESLNPSTFQALADSLSNSGYAGAKEKFLKEFLPTIPKITMDFLATVAKNYRIPVMVIVPEFNLLEWEGELSSVTPLLKDYDVRQWDETKNLAEKALAKQEWNVALQYAQKMLELDKGISSLTPAIMGKCYIQLGDLQNARKYFEYSRDAVCGLPIPHSPRCPAVIQEILREKSKEHNFRLIDLPQLFSDNLKNELPDSRCFLDYCHLNLEGIQLAMTAAAKELSFCIGFEYEQKYSQLIQPRITSEQEAIAQFLAAIHNAHYGQKESVIKYHCKAALNKSVKVEELMMAYLDSQIRKAPFWLCSSYAGVSDNPMINRYLSPRNNRTTNKLADFKLANIILDLLAEKRKNFKKEWLSLLCQEHADQKIDLLQPCYYAATFRESVGYSLYKKPAYYQAYTGYSNFYLIKTSKSQVQLKITYRIRGETTSKVKLYCNNLLISELIADKKWNDYEFTLGEEKTKVGVNLIQLEWPQQRFSYSQEIESAVRRLEKNQPPESLLIYGEIDSFHAVNTN